MMKAKMWVDIDEVFRALSEEQRIAFLGEKLQEYACRRGIFQIVVSSLEGDTVYQRCIASMLQTRAMKSELEWRMYKVIPDIESIDEALNNG
jgi:hypothetical protein